MNTIMTAPRGASRIDRGALDPLDELPIDFNPARMPILAQHWYGVTPLRPISQVAMVADLRFRRQVEHLHRLGPRAIGELLCEVAGGKDLDRALEPYQRLTPDLLKALGGNRFPPVPIHEVRR